MKVEVGKYYRTRDGRKVGPMRLHGDATSGLNGETFPFAADGMMFTDLGREAYDSREDSKNDLIAEWQEGPVRTVTRKEIVPGVYGRVRIDCDGFCEVGTTRNTAELRAAAATLIEIADALDGAGE